MSKEYKEWLQEQTFETLAADNYNTKLLLLAEQTKNKKLVEALEFYAETENYQDDADDFGFNYRPAAVYCDSGRLAQQALNEVNNAK